MFHQIRKMVGLTAAIMRTGAHPDAIPNCFKEEKKHLPIAPGAGLFLDKILFDSYNNNQPKEKRVDFLEEQGIVTAFKEDQIFPMVMSSEEQRKV